MVWSERIQTYILVGVALVFILMASGLGMNWLTGHEPSRVEFFVVLGGLGLIAALLWIRYAQRPPR
jgi:hypothetical protein